MSDAAPFTYVNESGRPPGRLITALGRVLPGVARVQADVAPFAAAWRSENLEALQEDNVPLWVALGDSLTLGIGAPAHDQGWVGLVRNRLAGEHLRHRVVNLAVSGATVEELIERQVPVLETLGADLVTVMIGSNDLTRPGKRRELPARHEAMLHRLPTGTIVTTLPNPTRAATQVNDGLVRVAAQRGLIVAELRDRRTSSWRGKVAADHFHPNERGYLAIAEVVGDAVLRAVRGA